MALKPPPRSTTASRFGYWKERDPHSKAASNRRTLGRRVDVRGDWSWAWDHEADSEVTCEERTTEDGLSNISPACPHVLVDGVSASTGERGTGGPFSTIEDDVRERAEKMIGCTLEESYAGFMLAIAEGIIGRRHLD